MATDACEPQIIRALEKDGWAIRNRPYSIRIRTGESVLADFAVQRQIGTLVQQVIIFEVKCFANPNADLHEFYATLGQYLYYRTALELAKVYEPIYLAIPQQAYQRLMIRQVASAVLRDFGVKLIVVDVETEEITQWID